jgi:urease subunit alpha
MFGGEGRAPGSLGVAFVAQEALQAGQVNGLRIGRRLAAVRGCRGLTKANLVANAACPRVEVHPEGSVAIDGRPVTLQPAHELPLTQRYLLV